MNHILALFRANHESGIIRLNSDFYKDIDWFLKFLPKFNGITFFSKPEVDETQFLYLDACLTGMGAVWRDRVYATHVLSTPGAGFTKAP